MNSLLIRVCVLLLFLSSCNTKQNEQSVELVGKELGATNSQMESIVSTGSTQRRMKLEFEIPLLNKSNKDVGMTQALTKFVEYSAAADLQSYDSIQVRIYNNSLAYISTYAVADILFVNQSFQLVDSFLNLSSDAKYKEAKIFLDSSTLPDTTAKQVVEMISGYIKEGAISSISLRKFKLNYLSETSEPVTQLWIDVITGKIITHYYFVVRKRSPQILQVGINEEY